MRDKGIQNTISSRPTLIVIVGPTASGKTKLAIQVASYFKTEILSADSRQFYKEMEIGTAKPTQSEQEIVPHHFIDSLSIKETYDVGKYELEALEVLDNIFNQKKNAVLVGGSGLFIKAVCEGLDDMPARDEKIRKQLNDRFEREGLSKLLQELEIADKTYYDQVDKHNPHRIIRALEVIRSSHQPYSTFRKARKKVRPFDILKIGLCPPRQILYERIDRRMDEMIGQGLFEEAESLLSQKNHKALQTVGYQEIFEFLEGKYDKEEAIRLLKRNSRRYAKRQLTWFRRDSTIKWFETPDKPKILQYLTDCLRID